MRPTRTPTDARDSVASAASLLLLALTSACAAPAAQHNTGLSDRAVVLDMPLVEQDAMYECGLVSVSALCAYYGIDLPQPDRERLARLARDEKGLSGAELCDELHALGFEPFLFRGTLDRGPTGLLAHVDARRPLLVMIAPRSSTNHYVLFLGYDDPGESVCVLDPVRGRVVLPRRAFEDAWHACDHFTLLALPSESSPAARHQDLPKEERS